MANPEYPDYPAGQDPTAIFAERLAEARGQGLPFAGALGGPGLGMPGPPRPTLAPTDTQGAPPNTLERIARAMQSFGAGMEGRLAPWQQIQQAQQDRLLKQQQMAMQERQLAMQEQMQRAQLPHLQAQTGVLAVDMFSKLSTLVQGLPDEQKQQWADTFAPLMVGMHQAVTSGPDGVPAGPMDLDRARTMLLQPGAVEQWVKEQQDIPVGDRRAAISQRMTVPQAQEFFTKRRSERAAAMMPILEQKLASYIEESRAANPTTPLTQGMVERGMEDFIAGVPDEALLKQYGVTKSIARNAISEWLGSPKSKDFLIRKGVAVGGQKPSEVGLTESLASAIQALPEFAALGIPISDWLKIPAAQRAAFVTTAQATIDAREIKKSRETGLAVELEKRKAPATGEIRANYVHIPSLLSTGEIVKPAAGITIDELDKSPDYAFAKQPQQEKILALAPTRQVLVGLQALADRLVTATSPKEAFQQGVTLYAGAYTGANPEAKAYLDSSEGFIANLSRSLGGERGVLTDRDRAVMRRAAVATFFDTKASKDIKQAVVADIYKASHMAAINEVAGRPAGKVRSELDAMLQKLDEESQKTYAKAPAGDFRVLYNPTTKQYGGQRRSDKVPQGWEALN